MCLKVVNSLPSTLEKVLGIKCTVKYKYEVVGALYVDKSVQVYRMTVLGVMHL